MQHTLESLKTVTLKVTYLGITAELATVKADNIANAFQTLDTEFGTHAHADYADVWKWSGHRLMDAAGSFTSFDDAQNWRCGEATEDGILSEGLGASGIDGDTFKSVNELLVAAEEAPLVMIDEDGEVTTDEDAADWGNTFLSDYANAKTLELLDSATWEIEEDGWDGGALLEIVKAGGSLESDANGRDEEELALALAEVAEANGYTHVATLSEDEDTFYADFKEPRGGVESWDELHEAPGIVSVQFQTRDSWSQTGTFVAYIFCEDAKLDEATEAWNNSDTVVLANLAREIENGELETREVETEAEFLAWAQGDDGNGRSLEYVVEYNGDTYAKTFRGDDCVLYRTTKNGLEQVS